MKSFGKSCLILILCIISVTEIIFPLYSVQGQLETSTTQQVPQHGMVMQFNYSPASPVINNYTTLTFNVVNSTTNGPVTNYVASVTVGNVVSFTGGSGYFNFSKIQVPSGNFSVNYAFPNDGLFPVYLRVDTPSTISVAEFKVIVPPPTVISSDNTTIIYVGVAVAAGAGVGIVFMLKRKPAVNR